MNAIRWVARRWCLHEEPCRAHVTCVALMALSMAVQIGLTFGTAIRLAAS